MPQTRLTRAVAALAFMTVPVAVWSGCGDDEGGSSGCTPNATQQCLCSATVMGVQRCSEDGASFEACDCSPVGSGGSGNGGSAGSSAAGASGAAGAPQPAPFTGATGLPCEANDDCEGGLTCIPSTSAENPFGTGGVQRGICTLACVEGDGTCQALDSASDCLLRGDATEGFCLPLCVLNDGNPQRCGGRVDMACVGFAGGGDLGFCQPQCSSDVDCGGRLCDPGTGLCVDALPTRGPGVTGAACTPATEATDCISGICLDIENNDTGFCTEFCVLGSPAGCGFSASVTAPDAACFPTNQNAALGDRGVCVELCNVDADCAQDRYICDALSAAGQDALGRVGTCLPPEEGADAGAPDAN